MIKIKHAFLLIIMILGSCIKSSNSKEEPKNEIPIPNYVKYGSSVDLRLNEVSGMIESVNFPKNFWVHNDSGDLPRIFRVNLQLEVVQEVELQGITHKDWEDIAYGKFNDEEFLFIGDIGDNLAIRNDIQIYILPEPGQEENIQVPIRSLRITYPDGPRDAEALLYDETYNELVIITKRDPISRVYTYNLDSSDTGNLEFVGELLLDEVSKISSNYRYKITGADAIDNRGIIIKNYQEVFLYSLTNSERFATALISVLPDKLEYTPELQGEAISLEIGFKGYWVTSECADDGGVHQPQPLFYYPFVN